MIDFNYTKHILAQILNDEDKTNLAGYLIKLNNVAETLNGIDIIDEIKLEYDEQYIGVLTEMFEFNRNACLRYIYEIIEHSADEIYMQFVVKEFQRAIALIEKNFNKLHSYKKNME